MEKLAISPFPTLAIPTMIVWNIMAMIGAGQILVGVFALVLAMKMLNLVSWSFSLTFFSTDLFLSLWNNKWRILQFSIFLLWQHLQWVHGILWKWLVQNWLWLGNLLWLLLWESRLVGASLIILTKNPYFSVCKTTGGETCNFPFSYSGNTYNECMEYYGNDWCRTDSGWGICSNTCN